MLLLLLAPPGGPDLCALAGLCQTAQVGTGTNLMFLASTLVLAGVVLHRGAGRRSK